MTAKLIQSKARELRRETRRQLLGTLAGPLAAAFFYAFGIWEFPRLGYVLHPLFAGAMVWSLAGIYFLNRGMWPAETPGDAGLSTGLEFCRRELERRYQLQRRVLQWSFGPVLLAIGAFILALVLIGGGNRGIFPNGLPFLALVVLWIAGYFFKRLKEQREIEREIDELNEIQRDNSGS